MDEMMVEQLQNYQDWNIEPVEQWNDPMEEAFHDPNFNSYDSGPGSNIPIHLQPANYKKGSNTFKLYVGNLSVKHTENAILNLFSKFGTVLSVYMIRSSTCAFVTYGSHEAATKALYALNNHPEHNFRVRFAKDKSPSVSRNQPVEKFNIMQQRENINKQYSGVPKCSNLNCSLRVFSVCELCEVPFCSKQCSVLGYTFHRGDCIRLPAIINQRPNAVSDNSGDIDNARLKKDTSLTSQQLMEEFRYARTDYNINLAKNQSQFERCRWGSDTNESSNRYNSNVSQGSSKNDVPQCRRQSGFVNDKQHMVDDFKKVSMNEDENLCSEKSGPKQTWNDLSGSRCSDDTYDQNNDLNRNVDQADTRKYSKDGYPKQNTQKGFKHFRKDKAKNKFDYERTQEYKLNRISIQKNAKIMVRLRELDLKNQPNVVSIRLVEEETSFRKLENDLARETDLQDWDSTQQTCLTHWNNKIVRAKVAFQSPFSIRIIDYYNECHPWEESLLKKIPPKYSCIPSFVQRVRFKNISVRETLEKHYKADKPLNIRFLEKESGIWNVQLAEADTDERSGKILYSVGDGNIQRESENLRNPKNERRNEKTVRFSDEFSFPAKDQHPSSYPQDEKRPVGKLSDGFSRPVREGCFPRSQGERQSRPQDDRRPAMRSSNEFSHVAEHERSPRFQDERRPVMKSSNEFSHIPEDEHSPRFQDEKRPAIRPSNEFSHIPEDERSPCSQDEKRPMVRSSNIFSRSANNECPSGSQDRERPMARRQVDSEHETNLALIPGKIFEACVTTIVDDEYFYIGNKSDLTDLSANLSSVLSNLSSEELPYLDDFRENKMCLSNFYDEWYRARIICSHPLRVFYVDFGNQEDAHKEDLIKIPESLARIRPLAIKVKLQCGSTVSYKAELYPQVKLKAIEKDPDGVWIVSDRESRNVVFGTPITDSETYVIDVKFLLDTKELQTLDLIPLKKNVEVGHVYLAYFDDLKYRVKVISTNPLKVDHIDCGGIDMFDEDLFELPEEWQYKKNFAQLIKLKPGYVIRDRNSEATIVRKIGEEEWEVHQ